jgi:hypothetical protein
MGRLLFDELRGIQNDTTPPRGLENCIPADEVKTRPAVAKPNWFERLMCWFSIHDIELNTNRSEFYCRNCTYNKKLREY